MTGHLKMIERRHVIMITFMMDLLLHGSIVFGWSSLSQIIGDQVPKETSALIFTLSCSLVGVLLFVFGAIRDFISFGVVRLCCYGSLTLIYLLLALTPYYPMFFFSLVFHFSAGFTVLIASLQLTLLFPENSTLLIGIVNGLASVSSMWPQIWLRLINADVMSFTTIMIIWAALTLASLVLGIIIYPWHNLSVCKECDTYREVKAKKFPLVTFGNEKFPTLSENIAESLAYLKSPMFLLQLVHLPIFHFMGEESITIKYY